MYRINWNNVVARFVDRFEREFCTCSKKAHFDCVPSHFTVIDGARSKWCHLLLFNALVGILDFESFNLAARRKFNQQKILCDCIKEELENNGIYEDKEDGTYGDIHVGVDNTWKDMKSLRTYLENNAPYKSKEKYHGILDILLSHKVIQSTEFDIVKTINAAIAKMLSPANRKGLQRMPDALPVAATVRSKRVLATLTEPAPPALPVNDSPLYSSLPPPTKRMRRNISVNPVQNEVKPMKTSTVVRRKPPSPQRQTSTSQHKPKFRQLVASSSIALEQQEETEEDRKFSFDHKEVFEDHDGTAAHTQPWELLETSPERNHSPKHYVHDGKVHHFTAEELQLHRTTSTASLHSPHAPSIRSQVEVEVTESPRPIPLRLLRPAECHMLPFPEYENLRGTVRAPPFPILDTAAGAPTQYGMSGF